jgi:CheY-like chemotaxis protein
MGKKILLADDSITIQKVISITFSSPDYEITIVDNGNDAIKKAGEVRPDIILTDIVMPGKNGYEVCDAVKSNPSLQSIPVLLLTGAFEAFDEQRAKQAGADSWLSKPFETQALIDKVSILLSKPAVRKPAETKAAVSRPTPPPPPSSRPGVPPPPPPRRAAAVSPSKMSPPPPAQVIPKEPKEEIRELSEAESFEITGDTIGDESGWETVPLGEEKEETRRAKGKPEEQIIEGFPTEKLSEEQFMEETKSSELLGETEESAVGFGDLEEAMEEAGKTKSEEPGQTQYEKTFEEQEIIKPMEPSIVTHNEITPQVGLSREELLEQASVKIESALKALLPEAVQQVVENKADAIIREVAEKIIWEVVPALTETMIKEEINRLKTAKKKA